VKHDSDLENLNWLNEKVFILIFFRLQDGAGYSPRVSPTPPWPAPPPAPPGCVACCPARPSSSSQSGKTRDDEGIGQGQGQGHEKDIKKVRLKGMRMEEDENTVKEMRSE
jgi:hypothetical protein